jgi:hypothetical protein
MEQEVWPAPQRRVGAAGWRHTGHRADLAAASRCLVLHLCIQAERQVRQKRCLQGSSHGVRSPSWRLLRLTQITAQ